MVEDKAKNDGGLSAETIQQTSAYPAVMYLLEAIPGSPERRAQNVAKVIQELFPEGAIGASGAHSALESFCTTHKLNVDTYLNPIPIQVNLPTSVTS